MTLIHLLAAIVIFGFGWGIGNNRGYHKGKHAGKAALLQQRIDRGKLPGGQMGVEDFEDHCHTTVTSGLYHTPDWFTHVAFKLFGEAGEFAEHVGKASRDDGWSIFKGPKTLPEARRKALIKELGDILWYIVMLAKELGVDLRTVMLENIAKRESRKARGKIKGDGDDR